MVRKQWACPFFGVRLLLGLVLVGGMMTVLASGAMAQAEFSGPPSDTREPLSLTGHVQAARYKYKIGPGDVLSLHVYHQEDLNQAGIIVRSDGHASFRGVGEIFVAGKTIDEITQIVESYMAELVRDPRVTIDVEKTKPAIAYVAGAVLNPGMFQLNTNSKDIMQDADKPRLRLDFRISNVLANAGGVMPNADIRNIKVTRADSGVVEKVDLWPMIAQGASDQDLYLQSGDSVFVPALPEMALQDDEYQLLLSSSIGPGSFPVRVIGEVGKPGVYYLNARTPYLNSALGDAGGFTKDSNMKVVAVRRFSANNNFTTLYLDPNKTDIMLRPNDVVFVSQSKVYHTGRFVDMASRALAPFQSLWFMAQIVP